MWIKSFGLKWDYYGIENEIKTLDKITEVDTSPQWDSVFGITTSGLQLPSNPDDFMTEQNMFSNDWRLAVVLQKNKDKIREAIEDDNKYANIFSDNTVKELFTKPSVKLPADNNNFVETLPYGWQEAETEMMGTIYKYYY